MLENLGEAVLNLTTDATALDAGISKARKSAQKLGNDLNSIGNKMSMFITLPLIAAGVAAVGTAASFEKHRVSLEVMLKSAEKAKVLLGDLEKFSAMTPFQFEGLVVASKRLIGFGIAAEDMVDTLTRLGNAAQGDAAILDRLTLAFGKMRSKGRVTLEELNMFMEAGVPILQQLADNFGVTTEEMFKLISTGKVGFEDVNQALTDLTTGQGQFAGIIEKQSETLSGKLSTLMDNVGLLGKAFGEILLPTITEIVGGLTQAVQWFTSLDEGTKKIIITFALLAAAAGPVIKVTGKLIGLFAGGISPITGVILALTALAAIITTVSIAIGAYNNRFLDAAKRHAAEREQIDKLSKEWEELKKSTDESAAAKRRLATVERQLTKLVGDSVFEYDEQGRAIDINTKKVREAYLKLYELEKRELERQEKKLATHLEYNAKMYEFALELQKIGGSTIFDYERMIAEYEAAETQLAEVQVQVIGLDNAMKDLKEGVEETAETVEETAETVDDLTGSLGKATKTWQEYFAGIQAGYENATLWAQTFHDERILLIEDFMAAKQTEEEMFAAHMDKIKEKARVVEEGIEADQKMSLQRRAEAYQKYSDLIIGHFGDIFGALGEAIATGKNLWAAFGKAALESIAAVIDAFASEALVQAAKNIAFALASSTNPFTAWMAPGYYTAAAQWGVVGALSKLGAGIVRGLASTIKLREGGEFDVPPGYPNDSFPMMVESGEHVSVTPRGGNANRPIVIENINIHISFPNANLENMDQGQIERIFRRKFIPALRDAVASGEFARGLI